MKNLKKVLALVLVIASLMGLATMASAATSEDYSDAASISHIEAVDVMSTIGVFDGISGAFSGDSILTREQAAKIITYMILGKDEADALVATVAPYTDVARDRWSAGSIAFCKNEGILAGVGYGKFDPDGKLTGVAFAKMCLVALGYDPDVEKLTGSSWAVNTSTIAIAEAGITADLSTNSLSGEMTRENACQMAFNTLKADLVDYEDRGMVITSGDMTISSKPSKAKPVDKATARVDERNSIGYINTGTDEQAGGTLQFAERYFNKLRLEPTTDSFGRPSNLWTYKSDKVGTYVKNSQLVQSWTAKVTKGEMYNAIGSSAVDRLKDGKSGFFVHVDDDGYAVSGDTVVSEYFAKNSTGAAGIKIAKSKSDNIGVSGNGVLTELYRDDTTGEVNVVMINTYLVQATADYNSTTERVNIEPVEIDSEKSVPTSFIPAYIDNDDFDVTGVKQDDYLLLTISGINWAKPTDKGSIESVTPATVQTGTVTEYTDNDDVTVGGTKYSYNKILGNNETSEEFAIDSDATLILDTYGYIMYVDEAVTSGNFVYIDDIDSTTGLKSKAVADAYFTDGTNAEITLSKVKKGSLDSKSAKTIIDTFKANPAEYRGWYAYTVSGGEYSLRVADVKKYEDSANHSYKTSPSGTKLIKNGTVKFLANESVKANDKTIFVVKNKDGDVDSYTGIANAPDVVLGGNNEDVFVSWICRKNDDDFARYVFVTVDGSDAVVDEVGGNVADYMFTLKYTGGTTHVNDITYHKCKVIIDGKEEERWVTEDMKAEGAGRLYTNVKEDSNGRISGGKEVGKEGNNSQRKFLGVMDIPSSGDPIQYYASLTYNVEKDTKITVNGSTLNIPALKHPFQRGTQTNLDKSELIVSGNKINVVINKGVVDLLDDDGADYETYLNVNANSLKSVLGDNNLAGRVYLVTDDDDSNTVETLWIWVAGSEES